MRNRLDAFGSCDPLGNLYTTSVLGPGSQFRNGRGIPFRAAIECRMLSGPMRVVASPRPIGLPSSIPVLAVEGDQPFVDDLVGLSSDQPGLKREGLAQFDESRFIGQ